MATKPQSEEHQRFENLLRAVVSVPHDELKKRLDEEKAARERLTKTASPTRRLNGNVGSGQPTLEQGPEE